MRSIAMPLQVLWMLALQALLSSGSGAEELKPAPAPLELPAPQPAGNLDTKVLKESSGLIKSPTYPGVFWTHNDSGDGPRLFAINTKGLVLSSKEIPGATNVDWEDISLDEKNRLVVGDIGNNSRKRKELVLYRVEQWDPGQPLGDPPSAQAFKFRYPPNVGAQDAEGLVVRGGFAYVFTKEGERTRVFRIPLSEQPPTDVVEAEFVAETRQIVMVTAAACSPDGRILALLSYLSVTTIELPAKLEETRSQPGQGPAPFAGRQRARGILLGQAEAIAWDDDDLIITTEGGGIWRMPKAR